MHILFVIIIYWRISFGFFILQLFFALSINLFPSKPRGLRAGRHLLNKRKKQRWADKQYAKANLGYAYKANPLGGASHAKGIVLEKVYAFFE